MAKFADPRYGKDLADKRATILKMTDQAVRHARTFTPNVEFSAEDAGRTDVGYLCEVIMAALAAGATTINIPDTTGYCLPREYADLFRVVRERCDLADDVVLSTHCHDDLGLAVANSLAGVMAGARQVECTNQRHRRARRQRFAGRNCHGAEGAQPAFRGGYRREHTTAYRHQQDGFHRHRLCRAAQQGRCRGQCLQSRGRHTPARRIAEPRDV